MGTRILVAPASTGKTAYVLNLARDLARDLRSVPRVVVPAPLQARAFRRRLAQAGGAIGVRVLTFDQLYAEVLSAAGEVYTELSDPVRYRLVRAVVDELPLAHYAPLVDRPGFVRVLEGLIGELKAVRAWPDVFAQAVAALGDEPRLRELALVYSAYQDHLRAQGWADRAGLGWLAVEALEERASSVAADWPLLAVDGFDNFTPVQLALLEVLASRVGSLIVTLTGTGAGCGRALAHRRFDRTRQQLEERLGVRAEPLPPSPAHSPRPGGVPLPSAFQPPPARSPCPEGTPLPAPPLSPALSPRPGGVPPPSAFICVRPPVYSPALSAFHPPPAPLAHLEAALFCGEQVKRVAAAGAIELAAAPDRAAEVRAALRWLKARLVQDCVRPAEVALLARDVAPYRPFLLQTAAEFGLPVRLVDGLPLRTNPAVAALLDLLRLLLPRAPDVLTRDDPGPALPRRIVIEAWRSPYFDWSAFPADGAAGTPGAEPIGIAPQDAEALDAAARWGGVIGGLVQWAEALASLAARSGEMAASTPGDEAPAGPGPAAGSSDQGLDEERGLPAGVPAGPAARLLWGKFQRFVQRLTPPPGQHPYREFVGWLEALIGSDPALESERGTASQEPAALRVVARAWEGDAAAAERDVAALQALKDVLRGLVWAEEALGTPAVGFPRFFDELAGAVEATSYRLPVHPEREEVLVADVVQARGLPFRAVAVLGLAEGEFPATLDEDPFLRDADRRELRERFGLPLEPSTESAEAEFFYEAVTRPYERLLLTRPRLADNGAEWQASPFWEEVRRLVDVEPETLTSESVPAPALAGSWPELVESLAAYPCYGDVLAWVGQVDAPRLAALEAAARLFSLRGEGAQGSPYDGDLSGLAEPLSQRFGPAHAWSTSRLEAYRACPFFFFVGNVLGLEPRQEPAEGLGVRQLGNVYHRIFERLYPAVEDPADLAQLLAALPAVAGAVLDAAPQQEGFRATAWWRETRAEIEQNVRRSLEALAQVQGDFVPYRYEAIFGLRGQPPLVVCDGEGHFRLRGLIDRVDRSPAGRLRIVDYKTAGPAAFTKRAVAEGKKLQVPLYALAARQALELGEPVEGFYWHVQQASVSSFTLDGFDGGPEEAMRVAVEHAWEVVRAARDGNFVPRPPDGGCPPYCPAVAFCWQRRPGFGG